MATLYIEEYAAAPIFSGGQMMQVAMQPPLARQTVSIGVGSVQSSAMNAGTKLVRVHTDVVCSVRFGTDPTAVATDARMAAGQTEYWSVPPGASYKVAVIENT